MTASEVMARHRELAARLDDASMRYGVDMVTLLCESLKEEKPIDRWVRLGA